jgi:hypothetical protein
MEREPDMLPVGTPIVHDKHGEGVIRGRIGRKFVSAWFGDRKRVHDA